MNKYSRLMRILLFFGLVKLAWACRRLYCPVPKSALVLEVGSGGSPYFRSNVLVDAYEETRERHWAPFVKDRPSVLGLGENLPFRDKVFDFVIASHVLEHSKNPEIFIQELQRVAKAGYIETPSAFMERINPYWDHRSEVEDNAGVLEIRKKPNWKVDSDLVELYERKFKILIANKIIPANPFIFHTRFYWTDSIPYIIKNPEVDCSWEPPFFNETTRSSMTIRARFGRTMLYLSRLVFSQRKRNKTIKLSEIMRCPSCKSSNLRFEPSFISCEGCAKHYKLSNNVPDML